MTPEQRDSLRVEIDVRRRAITGKVNRNSPRWVRVRSQLCVIHGGIQIGRGEQSGWDDPRALDRIADIIVANVESNIEAGRRISGRDNAAPQGGV